MTEQSRKIDPFTVEFSHGNRNVRVNVLGEVYRGEWSSRNINRSIGRMHQMPDIPGVQLRIEPSRGTVVVHDPMSKTDDATKDLSATIKGVMEANNLGQGELRFPEDKKVSLDKDRMKTLLCEIVRKIDAGSAKVVAGRAPTVQQVEACDGRELYDPGNSTRPPLKPKYVDEFDDWVASMQNRV